MDDPTRFQGLVGVAAILGLLWLVSENRRAISPRMVIGGLALQLGLGIAFLRSEAGRQVLDAAAAWVNAVLACAGQGAAFLFGDSLARSDGPVGFVFAFQVLPTIIFVAALFAVLYHLGVMQLVIRGVAWVTSRLLGSSGAETLNAAASIASRTAATSSRRRVKASASGTPAGGNNGHPARHDPQITGATGYPGVDSTHPQRCTFRPPRAALFNRRS